jgi:hypothetical protein
MKIAATLLLLASALTCAADDAWTITAAHIDPANYCGVTAANGMVGLVSSPESLKVKDVVPGGAFDNYGRDGWTTSSRCSTS